MIFYILLGLFIYFFKTMIVVIIMMHDEKKRYKQFYHTGGTVTQTCPVFHDDTRNCPYLRESCRVPDLVGWRDRPKSVSNLIKSA